MQAQSQGHEQLQEMELQNTSEAPSPEPLNAEECKDNPGQEEKQELHSEDVENKQANGYTEPDNPSQEQEEGQPPEHSEPPFSIFSSSERNLIVVIASLAALFSPLSANIYYPALNTLSEDLHQSLSKINLTITTYLVCTWSIPLMART